MEQNITTRLGGCKLLAVVFAVALAAHGGTSLFTDGLQVQFRTDHDGRVVADTLFPVHTSPINSWTTEDGVASPLTLYKVGPRPNWQTNAFQRADGTFLPAIRFRRNADNSGDKQLADGSFVPKMILASTEKTTLNLGTETTWFLVMNYLSSQTDGRVFGFGGDNPRFGAFVLGASSGTDMLRLHNNNNPGANSVLVMSPGGYLIDSRDNGSRMTCASNGVEAVNISQTATARSTPETFYVGRMLTESDTARFDAAELIVYNRALNDAEMRIVRNALAVRWGLPCADLLWTAAAEGFCDDLAGVGSVTATGTGRIPGAVETSGNAGGLALSVPSGSLAGTDGYLLVAHDGAGLVSAWDAGSNMLRIPRVWRVQSTLAAMPAVTVTVDGATVAPGVTGFACRLLYRADATQPFADTGLVGVSSGATVSFAFAVGAFKAGDYAVAIAGGAAPTVPAPGTEDITVWYSADTGVVTNESGAVTNWINQGSIGDVGDLHAYTGTVTVAENALTASDGVTTHNALRFATACLMTPGATSHGLAQNQLSSWFIVYEPSLVASEQTDAGLFGFNNNSERYGAFFRASDGGYKINCFQGGSASELSLSDIPKAWHVADMTQYLSVEGATRGSAAVQGVTAKSGGNQSYKVQTTAKFKVGHFREDAWGKFFNGGIAELRIYKRPLNPVERLHVAKELSEKYGCAFNHLFWVSSETASAMYRSEIQMTGLSNMAGTGGATGVMSGGLVITPGDDGGTAAGIWYAHNGANLAWTTADGVTTLARSWYLCEDGTSKYVPFPALRLNFLIGDLDDGSEYALYYRAADTDAWSQLHYAVTVSCGTASVRIPGGLFTGYFTLGKAAAGETVALPCAAVRNGLAGWYRADTGVETGTGDAVTAWRNLGVFGPLADVTTAAGSPRRATGAFARASGVSEASVSFDGSSYLMTSKDLKWQHVNNNNTWFAVFKVQDGITPTDMGIAGNMDGASRFGAFFTGSHDLRTHVYVSNESSKYCVVPAARVPSGQPILIDSARAGNTVDSYLDGQHQDGKQKGDMNAATSSKLMIGQMMSLSNKLKGDFAEFRVYNRTLSAAERNIVANHLAARYGITMRDNLLYGGAADDCVLDVVGIGRTTASGSVPNTSNEGSVTNSWSVRVAGNITVSDASAGLTLAAVGTLANGDYVLAGHGVKANAWVPISLDLKRMKRAWHITKTNAAALDLSLDFNLSDAGVALLDERERPAYKLVRSLDGGATWADVNVTLTQTAGGFTCVLPAAEYAEGQYTLAADVLARGTMLIFR